MALPRVDAMTARRVVAGEALCVLIALVLAENKDAVGSWIAVAVPLILQDVTLFLSLLRLQSKKAALLWAVPVVAKLLADIIVPLHADGVVQGMTSLILCPSTFLPFPFLLAFLSFTLSSFATLEPLHHLCLLVCLFVFGMNVWDLSFFPLVALRDCDCLLHWLLSGYTPCCT